MIFLSALINTSQFAHDQEQKKIHMLKKKIAKIKASVVQITQELLKKMTSELVNFYKDHPP